MCWLTLNTINIFLATVNLLSRAEQERNPPPPSSRRDHHSRTRSVDNIHVQSHSESHEPQLFSEDELQFDNDNSAGKIIYIN